MDDCAGGILSYDPAGRQGHKCYIQVVAWDRFQHYKDRNPPWIKFYNSLLEDPGMAALPDASKAHLFGLWLLASRLGNKIPNDAEFIGRRINATTPVDIKSLILFGFLEPLAECLQHDSNPLATCATTFPARTQSRAETEQSREEQIPVADAPDPSPHGVMLATTDHGPVLVVEPLPWNREAAELWTQEYHGAAPKQFFAALKPLVKRETWERVRPALVSYLAETPVEYVNLVKAFVGAFGTWEAKARGVSRAPPGKATSGDRTVAAMRAFVEGSGDNEIGVLGGARQIGSGSTSDVGRTDPDGLPRSAGGRGGS